MPYSHLTIEELQRLGGEDTEAMTELGRRVLKFDFCLDDQKYCSHRYDLAQLQDALDNEIPPECPHCGKFLTEH